MKEVFHMNAKQVLFVVPDDNDPHMGILIDHDYIICAECGASLKPMRFSSLKPTTFG